MEKVICFKSNFFTVPPNIKPSDLYPEEVTFYTEKILGIGKGIRYNGNRRESPCRDKAEKKIIQSISEEVHVWFTYELFMLYEYLKGIDELHRTIGYRKKEKLAKTFLSILLRKDPGTITEDRINCSEMISIGLEEKILQCVFPQHNSVHLKVMYTELANFMNDGNYRNTYFDVFTSRESHEIRNDVFNVFIGRNRIENDKGYFPRFCSIRDKINAGSEQIIYRRHNPFTNRVYFKVFKDMYFDPEEFKWKVGLGNEYNHMYQIVRHYSCRLEYWKSLIKGHSPRR